MKWGRGHIADGSEIIGVIDNHEFHPRVGLGSEISAGASVPISEVTLLAPIRPGKFIGLWNNYKAAAEKGGMEHPTHPLYFFKSDSSLSGQDADVELPISAGRVIFEGELGIVIGKTCKEVTAEKAEEAKKMEEAVFQLLRVGLPLACMDCPAMVSIMPEIVEELGIDQRTMRDAGIVFAITRVEADYLGSARLGDRIKVVTTHYASGAVRWVFDQTVELDGKPIFRAKVTAACMTVEGKPTRLPAEIRALKQA